MLYKYVGARTGPDTLQLLKYYCEQHTLKISEPTSFNDPFEFKIALDLDADKDTVRKRFFEDKPGASQTEYDDWRRHHTQQAK